MEEVVKGTLVLEDLKGMKVLRGVQGILDRLQILLSTLQPPFQMEQPHRYRWLHNTAEMLYWTVRWRREIREMMATLQLSRLEKLRHQNLSLIHI